MGEPETVTVVGAGSWGTALAKHLAEQGHAVTVWAREPEVVATIEQRHVNTLFLPDTRLPATVRATGDLERALTGADLVVSAVPTQFVRAVLSGVTDLLSVADLLVSVSKGIEIGTGRTPTQVFAEILPGAVVDAMVSLSGPSFAADVAARMPTAVVAASAVESNAVRVQALFSDEALRVYSSDDVIGVELGGALKNVIAIAAGICDGLGFGDNTRAMIVTRGLAEITRLGVALGGHPLTFSGLSGMGDLMLTCTGAQSRNRTVGIALGRGRTLDEILGETKMVAEGTKTVVAAKALAERVGVEMPITEQVHRVLYEDQDPGEAVRTLMRRHLRPEREH